MVGWPPGVEGIIPARAGFTPPPACDARHIEDHPRSRGVYVGAPVRARARRGSSPLARGLPHSIEIDADGRRIIPARAGFTTAWGLVVIGVPDHPRSRGVYISGACAQPISRGSSPLARGLQGGRLRPPPPHLDHPRSRGVYGRVGVTMGGAEGSSPLARGLPSRSCDAAHRIEDHPRSRGVYSAATPASARRRGSSPLARGLPHGPLGAVQARRIIPARAGFTRAPRCPCGPQKDHPRSRGVYVRVRPVTAAMTGSSPLARGLLPAQSVAAARERIIPARAGFTGPRGPPSWRPRDHPRSRGVYLRKHLQGMAQSGSSPLARGLPDMTRDLVGATRIIPARAGFTVGRYPR